MKIDPRRLAKSTWWFLPLVGASHWRRFACNRCAVGVGISSFGMRTNRRVATHPWSPRWPWPAIFVPFTRSCCLAELPPVRRTVPPRHRLLAGKALELPCGSLAQGCHLVRRPGRADGSANCLRRLVVRKGNNALRPGIWRRCVAAWKSAQLRVLAGACPPSERRVCTVTPRDGRQPGRTPVDEHNHALGGWLVLEQSADARHMARPANLGVAGKPAAEGSAAAAPGEAQGRQMAPPRQPGTVDPLVLTESHATAGPVCNRPGTSAS